MDIEKKIWNPLILFKLSYSILKFSSTDNWGVIVAFILPIDGVSKYI